MSVPPIVAKQENNLFIQNTAGAQPDGEVVKFGKSEGRKWELGTRYAAIALAVVTLVAAVALVVFSAGLVVVPSLVISAVLIGSAAAALLTLALLIAHRIALSKVNKEFKAQALGSVQGAAKGLDAKEVNEENVKMRSQIANLSAEKAILEKSKNTLENEYVNYKKDEEVRLTQATQELSQKVAKLEARKKVSKNLDTSNKGVKEEASKVKPQVKVDDLELEDKIASIPAEKVKADGSIV